MINLFLFIVFAINFTQDTNGFWGNNPWSKLSADSGIKKICTEKLSEEQSPEQKERAHLCENLKNFILGKNLLIQQADGLPNFSEEIKSTKNPFMSRFLVDQQINAYVYAIALTAVMTASDKERPNDLVNFLTSDRLHNDKEILTKEYYKNN